LQRFLADAGVTALTHYPIAIHRQEGYPWGGLADKRPLLPNTEWNAAQCLSLPMYPEMIDDEVSYVIETVKKWSNK
jgi:dTDP-4-amino-4,6-dideoxygalactose transaminase